MVIAALVISAVALTSSALVALAVMEMTANRVAGPNGSTGNLVEQFEIPESVLGTVASDHDLPAWIDAKDRHLVLFVSPMCTLCGGIVGSFHGDVPEGLTVVVTASHAPRQRDWAAVHGLPASETLFDEDMAIVSALGVSSSPTVVGFGVGRVAFMAGVGGRAALDDLLEQRITFAERTESMESVDLDLDRTDLKRSDPKNSSREG